MPFKVSAALLAIILIAGAVLGAVRLGRAATTKHDGWDIFSPVPVTTDPVLIDPGDLLAKSSREELEKVVTESRNYGLPFTVHVITASADSADQSADEIAAARYKDTPVETSKGAGDGLLMVVIVSEADHTQTGAGFATGPNFYPRGGITPERLKYIADVQMRALIDDNRIGDAVVEGATWAEWTQLFETTPNPSPGALVRGLRDLLEPWGALLFGGLAALVLAAAAGAWVMTRRDATTTEVLAAPDGVAMAATARGRVDRAVLAGATLDALDRGVLALDHGRLRAGGAEEGARDRALLAAIQSIELRGGIPTPSLLGRYLDRDGTLRREMEDRLAAAGLLARRAPVLTTWLRWIAVAGTVLGLLALVLSVLGASAIALAPGIALTAVSIVTLIWNEKRSWATRAGLTAVRAWRQAHADPASRERALYEAITGMGAIDLLPADRSPLRPDAQELAAALAL